MDWNKKLECLDKVVGRTPMYELELRFRGERRMVYAKAEQFNFTGSIKDRMALHVLRESIRNGLLKPGDRITEATSGNTGIAFSGIGSALGLPVRIYMPNWMSAERKALIAGFGAEICLVSKEEGGFLGSIARCEKDAAENDNIFLPRQFSNDLNPEAHYRTTGPEIVAQLHALGLKPDAFVAGVGTGGTVMGVGRYLREEQPSVRIYPLEPDNSPTMRTGYKVGNHRIQGISDEFIPEIVKLDQLDEIIDVDDGDAIIASQMLAKVGIGVGISSGANLLGALKVQDLIGTDKVVVTVFSDCNKKYVSTDLMKEEPKKESFLSNDLEIINYRVIPYQNEA
ncbi:MAG: PLP-dependent cysteine synthase family protein [Bacillota bacterium]|nr:PLP-dependent cysteine synthase family protein [Bacillota bacterium]